MTINHWALQDAKARLSELVKLAQGRPQVISVRGTDLVVVLSKKKYQELISPKLSFVDFFRKSPLVGLELDLKREESKNRDIEL